MKYLCLFTVDTALFISCEEDTIYGIIHPYA